MFEFTSATIELLKKSGSADASVAIPAQRRFIKSLELPLRQGIMSGDIHSRPFERIKLDRNATAEFPLDLLAPGTEKDFVAYTIPTQGRIPQRHVEGDFVIVPTYSVASSIDWLLKYARDARWDIVRRAMEILELSFVKKLNDDAWHTLMAAGVDRNIVVFDSDANAGQFTKRLVSLTQVVMRRNGGGNSTSTNRGKLTDLYLSPDGVEDMRNWQVDQVDDVTRRQLFVAPEGGLSNIYGVNLHDIDELGEGQEYQTYFTSQLSGTLASGDVELAVGLDLTRRDSFVMPVREELAIFEDPYLHREQRAGSYGWMEVGFGALDNRRIVLCSF